MESTSSNDELVLMSLKQEKEETEILGSSHLYLSIYKI